MAGTVIERSFEVDDFEIKRTSRGRTVTAYAAVFNEEAEIRDAHGHYLETIHRSAFNRTLSHGIGRVNVFYNHGYDLTGKPNGLLAVPFATPEDIRADGKGLLTVSRYNDGELADAVLAAWEGGQIKGQSFRGSVFNSAPPRRGGRLPVIERTELGLKEYGPTHSPAYTGAGLVAIRSQDDLLELVRSMIQEVTGTSQTPPVDGATSDPEPGASEGPPAGHPSRTTLARRNLMVMRARDLGVLDATEVPQAR